MRTLQVTQHVEDSLVGTAILGSRFPQVQIGKTVPLLTGPEDAESLSRCGFLDLTLPIELNLIATRSLLNRLEQRRLNIVGDGQVLNPERLLPTHPVVASVPPEIVSSPNSLGLKRLYQSCPVGGQVARLRFKARWRSVKTVDWENLVSKRLTSDARFWKNVESSPGLYDAWLSELREASKRLLACALAPPVPVLSSRFPESAVRQSECNLHAARALLSSGSGSAEFGLLYSFHMHPNAVRDVELIRRATQQLSQILHRGDNPFWGVHVAFTDMGVLCRASASIREATKDAVADVAKIATSAPFPLFTWISNVGVPGHRFLDSSVAFASYHPGITPRRIYPIYTQEEPDEPDGCEDEGDSGGYTDEDGSKMYGKVLNGPWDPTLLDYSDLEGRGWRIQENGKFPAEVPPSLRGAPWRDFRTQFGKPANIAVMDKLNEEREHELTKNGNARIGAEIVRRSRDGTVSGWA